MKFDNMDNEELLDMIREAQLEYISRVHPAMGESVTMVTDEVRDSLFYSDNLDETLVVGTNFAISVSSDGRTASAEGIEWELDLLA